MIGKVRSAVQALPAYRPGKAAEQAEAEHGITNAIKLASNENPFPPVPAVIESMTAAASQANRYCDHLAVQLRQSLARWIGLDTAQIAVGCGSVGLLQQLCLTYLEPGDNAVYPWRSFEAYPIYVQLVGAESVKTPLVNHAFDLDAVVDAVDNRTRLIFLATPNNPTGTAVATSAIDDLARRVRSDVIILVDEAYHEFVDPALGDPIELLAKHPNLVISRTFSKAYGLAGLRVGYMCAHPEIVTELDKSLIPFAVNGIAQAAALSAIDNRSAYEPLLAALLEERARVVAALVEDGWEVPPTEANFFYLPLGDATTSIYTQLERRGVVTRPFANEGIRVTIGNASENDRFLLALAELSSLV